jgi:hypothetical protein
VLFGREYRGVGRLVGGLSLFGRERAVEVLSVDSRFRRRAIYGGSMDSCSSAEITWLSVDSRFRRRAIDGESMDSCSSAEITSLSVDLCYSVE